MTIEQVKYFRQHDEKNGSKITKRATPKKEKGKRKKKKMRDLPKEH